MTIWLGPPQSQSTITDFARGALPAAQASFPNPNAIGKAAAVCKNDRRVCPPHEFALKSPNPSMTYRLVFLFAQTTILGKGVNADHDTNEQGNKGYKPRTLHEY